MNQAESEIVIEILPDETRDNLRVETRENAQETITEDSSDQSSVVNKRAIPDFNKTRSKVYEHFKWISELRIWKCNYCGHAYEHCKRAGGSNLTNHINRHHKEQVAQLASSKRSANDNTVENIFTKAAEASKKRVKFTIEKEKFRKVLNEFIVDTSQPFNIVQRPSFKNLMYYTSKGDDAATLPSDKTVSADVTKMFLAEKEELKQLLRSAPGKISFVIDGWSSSQFAFQGVIARWIDTEWKIQNRVIDLTELHGSHTGSNMATAFDEVLTDFGLWDKLFAITTDNASNMNTFFEELSTIAEKKCYPFDAANSRVRCMAHVLNLACKSIIKTASGEVSDVSMEDLDKVVVESRDFVGRIRRAVVAIRSSPQRREIFKRQCNQNGLKLNMPIRDVETRWNSTLAMLVRAVEQKSAIMGTLEAVRATQKYMIAAKDWENAEKLITILQPFQIATVTLSNEHSPTLSDVSAVYQVLFDHLENFSTTEYSTKNKRRKMPASKIDNRFHWMVMAANSGWEKLQKYYPSSDADVCIIATILDPRLKTQWYKVAGWKKEWIDSAKKSINAIWNKAYKPLMDGGAGDTDTDSSIKPGAKHDLFKNIYSQKMACYNKSDDELKRYLSDGTVNPDVVSRSGCGGALGWWKMHDTEYPNLSKMARDYLSASGSGVPIERIFSSGPDVISFRRQSLSSVKIKQSMCLKNWLHEKLTDGDSLVKEAIYYKLGLEEEDMKEIIDIE